MIEIKNLKGEVVHMIKERSLRCLDLSKIDLTDADLTYVNLARTNLQGANLRHANLTNAYLYFTDLTNANLTNANLKNVELWGTIGNGKEIKNLNGYYYKIAYTKDVIYIGCEGHTLKEWSNFTDAEIEEMDGLEAMDFWAKYRAEILTKIKADPTE